jgi:hypothetical protein
MRKTWCVFKYLATGAHKSEQGSWGGPNMFSKTAVDNDRREYELPVGVAASD